MFSPINLVKHTTTSQRAIGLRSVQKSIHTKATP